MKISFNKIFDFIKLHKIAFISGAVAVVVLAAAFAMGGNIGGKGEVPNPQPAVISPAQSADEAISTVEPATAVSKSKSESSGEASAKKTTEKATESRAETSATQSASKQADKSKSDKKSNNSSKGTKSEQSSATKQKQDKYKTDPVPKGKPQPVEPQEQVIEDTRLYCTFSISCATILDNMSELDPDKTELVPSDGWILKPTKVEFNEGESVFDVLQRVCKDKKIHMEFSFTPLYNSAYIEGINNLYEFDCGFQSGWMFSVNDWFPNYGVSRYQLKNGDTVEFKYTCNGYGADIGATMSLGE